MKTNRKTYENHENYKKKKEDNDTIYYLLLIFIVFMVFICFAVGFHSGFHLVFIVFIVSQWFSLGLHLRIGHPTQNNEMCCALPLTTRYVAVHGEQIDERMPRFCKACLAVRSDAFTLARFTTIAKVTSYRALAFLTIALRTLVRRVTSFLVSTAWRPRFFTV
jgi:hypothetical protein